MDWYKNSRVLRVHKTHIKDKAWHNSLSVSSKWGLYKRLEHAPKNILSFISNNKPFFVNVKLNKFIHLTQFMHQLPKNQSVMERIPHSTT